MHVIGRICDEQVRPVLETLLMSGFEAAMTLSQPSAGKGVRNLFKPLGRMFFHVTAGVTAHTWG